MSLLAIFSGTLLTPSRRTAIGVAAVLLLKTSSALGQTTTEDTIKQLMDRLTAAEAKIQQLESAKQAGSNTGAPVSNAPSVTAAVTPVAAPVAETPAQEPAPEAPPAQPENHDHMMEIPGGPVLHFRGFFDFNFDTGSVAQQLKFPLPVKATNSFRAGEFDLFMSSQLSDKLSFISELVLSTDSNNSFGLDLERFQLTYRPSRYFEISGGRYHTDIGYYNTHFHHGNWFSTATGRPFMYYFEDSGGSLPVHQVGVTTTGYIPGSGKLDLHWTAEIGNGSSEVGASTFGDGVENSVSDRNRKDINFAIYSRPEWIPGLQVGGSFLRGDLIASDTNVKVNNTVSSAYVVFINSKWEFMNEAVLMQHQITQGGRSYSSPMGYTQISRAFGKYRPYFRFQEVNIPNNDPVTLFKGRYEGPSAGVRMDFFDFAALKFQYNRVFVRDAAAQNGFEAQMAFTF